MKEGKPRIAFFPAHPAQLWLMYFVSRELEGKVEIYWVLRDKDVLVKIANKLQIQYIIISKAKTGIVGNTLEFFINIFKSISITKKKKIKLWFTKYGAGNIAARACKIKSISFNDDDIDIVPFIAITSYPFANEILAPKWVRMGRYAGKTTRFNASNELIYLHPNRFLPIPLSRSHQEPSDFILIRLSALTAHHDVGIAGISEYILNRIIMRYADDYQIYVSSEKKLSEKFNKYRLPASVEQIHGILQRAKCIVTDSLSMALEAAVLGTPSVRISDFGLEISALKAFEKYELIFNYPPDKAQQAIEKMDELLILDKVGIVSERSNRLMKDMEDPLPIFTKAILRHLYLI